jgi:hypothetical protein
MQREMKLTATDTALTVCFTALYTTFCFWPAFPIVGLPGYAIPLAALMAPVIGIIVGSYLGMLSTFLGGAIGFFAGHFSTPSFVSGIVAAFFAGMLYAGRRSVCAFVYFSLLFFFGFYPFVGPVWVYPLFMWFQIIGFLVLISPLQSMALKNMRNPKSGGSRLLFAFFIISLISTLAGQIAGSLTFELTSWPIFIADVQVWARGWQFLTWIYPIERIIIASSTTFIGVFLYKVLMFAKSLLFINREKHDGNIQCSKVFHWLCSPNTSLWPQFPFLPPLVSRVSHLHTQPLGKYL